VVVRLAAHLATFMLRSLTCSVCADPFANDENFLLSMLTLEELGATGNKGLIGLTSNPVLANGIAGLATSATAQATIEVGTPLTLSLYILHVMAWITFPSSQICLTQASEGLMLP